MFQQVALKAMSSILPRPSGEERVVVLLVEDDPVQQETIHRLIRQSGVAVETASTIREALEKIKAGKSDILILDWRLSGSTAQVVFDSWLDEYIGNPCAIISAHITAESRSQFVRDGAWNVLEKPADLEALMRIIHRYAYQVKRDREILALREEVYGLKRTTFALLLVALVSMVVTNYDQLRELVSALVGAI